MKLLDIIVLMSTFNSAFGVTKSGKESNNYDHRFFHERLLSSGTIQMDDGFCVKADGGDQNSGVIKLYSKDAGPSDSLLQECHKTCDSESKKRDIQATGCEAIWNQWNRGCYLHTQSISHGNGYRNHACWTFPETSKMDNGFCVKADGGDQNSGVVKLYSKDAGPSDSLLQECHEICDSESKERDIQATGCEAIWNQWNRGCYLHTQSISHGNGYQNHACWVNSSIDQTEEAEEASTDPICAVENEKAISCRSKKGKEVCCPGLVCHHYQYWRCVNEENIHCSGPNTLAQECGAWKKHSPFCCPGLVCDGKRCVPPKSQEVL